MNQVAVFSRWAGTSSVKWAWGIWGIFALVVFLLVWFWPTQRTVTHHYRVAAEKWMAGESLYTAGTEGFLYFPQSAILYIPFALSSSPAREVLWRAFILALYATAVWRLARMASSDRSSKLFLVATILAIPAALSSARSGQINMPMSALMIHAGLEMMEKRWWRAAIFLIIALGLKPLALVMALLAGAVYPQMRWKLLGGVALLVALPFLIHWNWDYVREQYLQSFDKIFRASAPERHEWCNLDGLLRFLHIYLSREAMTIVRIVVALATLGAAWKAVKKFDVARSSFIVLTLSVCYLMLFNPRTETNSYVMLSPLIGVWAASAFFEAKRMKEGWFLTFLAIGLGCDSYGDYIHPYTNLWFKALLCVLFLGYFLVKYFKKDSQQACFI